MQVHIRRPREALYLECQGSEGRFNASRKKRIVTLQSRIDSNVTYVSCQLIISLTLAVRSLFLRCVSYDCMPGTRINVRVSERSNEGWGKSSGVHVHFDFPRPGDARIPVSDQTQRIRRSLVALHEVKQKSKWKPLAVTAGGFYCSLPEDQNISSCHGTHNSMRSPSTFIFCEWVISTITAG